jgi:hypothetical protein
MHSDTLSMHSDTLSNLIAGRSGLNPLAGSGGGLHEGDTEVALFGIESKEPIGVLMALLPVRMKGKNDR